MTLTTVMVQQVFHSPLAPLWRTVKYEHVYLHEYALVPELEKGLGDYFRFYNQERLHQNLSYQPPAEVHFAGLSCPIAA